MRKIISMITIVLILPILFLGYTWALEHVIALLMPYFPEYIRAFVAFTLSTITFMAEFVVLTEHEKARLAEQEKPK